MATVVFGPFFPDTTVGNLVQWIRPNVFMDWAHFTIRVGLCYVGGFYTYLQALSFFNDFFGHSWAIYKDVPRSFGVRIIVCISRSARKAGSSLSVLCKFIYTAFFCYFYVSKKYHVYK